VEAIAPCEKARKGKKELKVARRRGTELGDGALN